jgi:hypothetical protein
LFVESSIIVGVIQVIDAEPLTFVMVNEGVGGGGFTVKEARDTHPSANDNDTVLTPGAE